jgi:hypothetical protein
MAGALGQCGLVGRVALQRQRITEDRRAEGLRCLRQIDLLPRQRGLHLVCGVHLFHGVVRSAGAAIAAPGT